MYEVLFTPSLFWIMEGWGLLAVLAGCDLIVGPILMFFACVRKKTSREFALDIFFVVSVQLGFLFYGIASVYDSRPVCIVFNISQFNVIRLSDIAREDLVKARVNYLPGFKGEPVYVYAEMPGDDRERQRLMMRSISQGRDLYNSPKYFSSLDSHCSMVGGKLLSRDVALMQFPAMSKNLSELPADLLYAPVVFNGKVFLGVIKRGECTLSDVVAG